MMLAAVTEVAVHVRWLFIIEHRYDGLRLCSIFCLFICWMSLQGAGYAQSVPWSTKLPAKRIPAAAGFRTHSKAQQIQRIEPVVVE